MSEDVIFHKDEATKGGFQAILKVEGILTSITREPSVFEASDYGEPADQAVVKLDDTVILEMEAGEPEPDLKDGGFTYRCSYAKPGKEKPNVNSFFVKGILTSADKVAEARGVKGGTFRDLLDTRVTMERQEVYLFRTRKDEAKNKAKEDLTDDDYEEVRKKGLVFVEDDGGTSGVDLDAAATKLIVGNKKHVALSNLLRDGTFKRKTEYIDAVKSGAICDMLNLEVVDGVYQAVSA